MFIFYYDLTGPLQGRRPYYIRSGKNLDHIWSYPRDSLWVLWQYLSNDYVIQRCPLYLTAVSLSSLKQFSILSKYYQQRWHNFSMMQTTALLDLTYFYKLYSYRYLYKELKNYYEGKESIFCDSEHTPGLAMLKPDIALHHYISTAPCGDGALFSPRYV